MTECSFLAGWCVVFQETGGEAMGWHSQTSPPTSCQHNKAPKSSPALPCPFSLPYAHLSSPCLYPGHDCVGVVGSPASRHTWLPAKKKNGMALEREGNKEKEKEFWLSTGYNSTAATRAHKTHSCLTIPSPLHGSAIYQEKLWRSPWSSCYYANLLG